VTYTVTYMPVGMKEYVTR